MLPSSAIPPVEDEYNLVLYLSAINLNRSWHAGSNRATFGLSMWSIINIFQSGHTGIFKSAQYCHEKVKYPGNPIPSAASHHLTDGRNVFMALRKVWELLIFALMVHNQSGFITTYNFHTAVGVLAQIEFTDRLPSGMNLYGVNSNLVGITGFKTHFLLTTLLP